MAAKYLHASIDVYNIHISNANPIKSTIAEYQSFISILLHNFF